MSPRRAGSRAAGRATAAGAVALATALLAGCGSSSTSPVLDSGSLTPSGQEQAQAGLRSPAASRQARAAAAGAISFHPGPARARPPYEGTNDDELNSSGAKPLNPCALVTRSEARAILGQPIADPLRAPQGPTCIYEPRDAKTFVTVTVEPARSSALRQPHRGGVIRLTLAGHRAYCVRYGTLIMLVPLSGGRVLNVTAPCPIAARFAAKALPRLAG